MPFVFNISELPIYENPQIFNHRFEVLNAYYGPISILYQWTAEMYFNHFY